MPASVSPPDVETLLRVADSRMFDQKRLHRILSV
jgi:hypothetical protein